MQLPPNFSWIELAWIAWCGYTLFRCGRRLWNARIDRRVADSRRSVSIANGNIFGAATRFYRQAVYVGIGIRALTRPPSTPSGDVLAATAIALAFISLAILDQIDVRREERNQTRLLAEEEQQVRSDQERAAAARRDPARFGLRESDKERSP